MRGSARAVDAAGNLSRLDPENPGLTILAPVRLRWPHGDYEPSHARLAGRPEVTGRISGSRVGDPCGPANSRREMANSPGWGRRRAGVSRRGAV